METTRKFKLFSGFAVLIDVCLIIMSVGIMFFFISYFQFFRIEEMIFKNDIFRIPRTIRIMFFLNTLCGMENIYAMNIASKTILNLTSSLQIFTIIVAGTLLATLVYSFNTYYSSQISFAYYSDFSINNFIEAQYSHLGNGNNCSKFYVQEIAYISNVLRLFLIISMILLFVSVLLTKSTTMIKISEPEMEIPSIHNVNKVCMNTASLRNIKVVLE